jgi:hypothetical protein
MMTLIVQRALNVQPLEEETETAGQVGALKNKRGRSVRIFPVQSGSCWPLATMGTQASTSQVAIQ